MYKIKNFLSLLFIYGFALLMLYFIVWFILIIIFNAHFLFLFAAICMLIILICHLINKIFTEKVKSEKVKKAYRYFIILLYILFFSALIYQLDLYCHDDIVDFFYENKKIITLVCICIGVSILEKINS